MTFLVNTEWWISEKRQIDSYLQYFQSKVVLNDSAAISAYTWQMPYNYGVCS